MKIHEYVEEPDDGGEVTPPWIMDPRKPTVYAADGEPLRKGVQVMFYSGDTMYRGTVRRVDLMTVVVGVGSFLRPYNLAFRVRHYDLDGGYGFHACPQLGVDEFLANLLS